MITIIVPIYNVEKFIDESIRSIINQTYQNIEIILVNDGSTDRSGEICEEYAKKDKRIKVINKENGGAASARNAGLDQAKGKYISFIDSDDWIEPDFIEVLLNAIETHEGDISQCSFFSGRRKKSRSINLENSLTVINGKSAIKHLYNRRKYIETVVVWNKLYKKEIFDSIRFKEGIIYEDEAIIHELLYKCNRLVINQSVLYHYRVTPNSVTQSGFSLKKLNIIDAIEMRLSFFKEKDEDELYQMTIPSYFRALLSAGASLYYSNIENKQSYLTNVKKTINRNLINFTTNKYMKIINRFLLYLYKFKPNLGLYFDNRLMKFKVLMIRLGRN